MEKSVAVPVASGDIFSGSRAALVFVSIRDVP
jgi:hypothetical protein